MRSTILIAAGALALAACGGPAATDHRAALMQKCEGSIEDKTQAASVCACYVDALMAGGLTPAQLDTLAKGDEAAVDALNADPKFSAAAEKAIACRGADALKKLF